ncbi:MULTISPECIES: alpha/beta fold hydrolase [unclassified Nocardia]|uniref:alpha/beta fold hydrolase n=1 Tax=unclassified Nocardia TaxID=2637762 RepID=UPI001CE3CFFA|nr:MULTISPECIES: alpha/beta fold hydrolase [unclassified Nocardia]
MIHYVPTELGQIAVHMTGRDPSDAPNLLLLHANPGDHRDFDQIVPALAKRWSIAAVDWPGYGQSTVLDPLSVTAGRLADVTGRVWDALAAMGFRTVTVIGNSVGGYAAIRLAECRPGAVAGLVLVQSAGFAPLNAMTRTMFRVMGNRGVALRTVAPLARAYLGALDRGGVRTVYERAEMIPADPVRLDVYCSVWRSFAEPRLDLRRRAPILPDIPVRVVWGKFDPINPWVVNRRGIAAALPHAEVVLLPTRHEPFCERPDLFLDAVTPFLDQRAGIGS